MNDFISKMPDQIPIIFLSLFDFIDNKLISHHSVLILRNNIERITNAYKDQLDSALSQFEEKSKCPQSIKNNHETIDEILKVPQCCPPKKFDYLDTDNILQTLLEMNESMLSDYKTNVSHAILNLDGTFKFACPVAQKQFGMSRTNIHHFNFGEILLPFSLEELEQKYPEGIFSLKDNRQIQIKYAIFSKHSEKLFLSKLPNITQGNLAKVTGHLERETLKMIATESLTSIIQRISLKDDIGFFNKLKKNESQRYQLFNGILRSNKIRKTNSKKGTRIRRTKIKIRMTDTEINSEYVGMINPRKKFNQPAKNGSSIRQFDCILMRTFPSLQMKNYKYEELNDHEKIKRFKKRIQFKLKKIRIPNPSSPVAIQNSNIELNMSAFQVNQNIEDEENETLTVLNKHLQN